jgi:hypothetical protein
LPSPVNTEIAQVRGHDGYGFPKWRTELDVEVSDQRVTARVTNADGGVDVAFSAPTPKQKVRRDTVSSLTSYTQLDGTWRATLNQTNVLASGSSLLSRGADLTLGEGRMADELRALRPLRTIRLDVATKAQAALHMPISIAQP